MRTDTRSLFFDVPMLLINAVIRAACVRLGQALTPAHLLAFLCTLLVSVAILDAILLAFAGLVFWSPGFLFTWVFDGIMRHDASASS